MTIKKKLQENSDKIDEFRKKKKISKLQGFIIVFIMAWIFFTLTGDLFKIDSWYPLRISWVNPVASIQKTINTVNKESKK